MRGMLDLAPGAIDLLAQVDSISDLAPYLALVGAGFLVGAWGSSAKSAIAVVLGILMIAAGIFLFQQRDEDFGGLPPRCEQPPCP
jgi:hypothetical protein